MYPFSGTANAFRKSRPKKRARKLVPEVGTRKSPPELTDRVSLSHDGRHAQGKAPKGASNNEAAATMSTPGQFDVPRHLKPDFT